MTSVLTSVDQAKTSDRVKPRWRRADAPTVVLHWLVALLFIVSLTTGFRVAADAFDAGLSSEIAAWISPQGIVLFWHIGSALALISVATGYAVFLNRARQADRIMINAARLADLRSPSRRRRWISVNVLVYWLAYILLATVGITGLAMYSDMINRAHWAVADIHRLVAWGLVVYVVLHVAAQLAKAGWRALYAIVVPRRAFGRAALVAGAGVVISAAALYALDIITTRSLEITSVQNPPLVDGFFDDPAWKSAPAVTIQTAGGANLIAGGTVVTLKAVHDAENAYFLFEWQDQTRSLKHHPLEKTVNGWRMVQNGYAGGDETDYYEDKFAVMLSDTSRFAALRSAHLGPRPVEGLPGASGQRGLHYTDEGTVLDVWHWMAVRTNPFGQAEDDYFGALRPPPDSPMARYAGGYALDPASMGGSLANWKDMLESPISRSIDGAVVPRYLPEGPSALKARLGEADLAATAIDSGDWWLSVDETSQYSADLEARFPEGTIVPSVLLRGPIEGDRGDVSASGTWSDGIWRLEIKRALDTDSPYDVTISDGTYLWVAVFDHAQTRHSWHMRPVRLRIR